MGPLGMKPEYLAEEETTMRVLLHVDGADDPEAAISLLRLLVPGDGTFVHIAAVVPEMRKVVAPCQGWGEDRNVEGGADVRSTPLDALAGEVVRALEPHFGEVTHEIRTGEPSTQILQVAEAIGADLIVLGTRSEAGRRAGLGSVARKVVERAATPVLIARPIGPRREGLAWPGDSSQSFRVLLATDGSPCAVAAAGVLSGLALPDDAETVLLTVIRRSRPIFTPRVAPTCRAELARALREIREQEDESAEAALERTRASLVARQAQVRWITREGDPPEEIARVAEEMNADLVVMGTRGLSRLRRVLWGSVSQRVANSVACSVLLVRLARGTGGGPGSGN